MAAPLDCLGTESWQALLATDLPPDDQEPYECHLESCPVCRRQLERIAAVGDDFLRLGRQIGDPTVAPADLTLEQVLERLLEVKSRDQYAAVEPADLYFLRPADRPDILGTLGAYEVREVIGQGGMGVVLKAYDPALHRLVAIKVLAAAVAGSATARMRFSREAQAAAAVRHDHVVAVHGVHETNGLPYLVMQYIAGESLQDRLDRAGPLEVVEVVRVGLQTASGLAAAHAQGLIHRDIKPANLLLEERFTAENAENAENAEREPEGNQSSDSSSAFSAFSAVKSCRIKITDFGLARMTDDVGLTQAGVVAGTPEYMAPEQARGESVDHRADLFSLGSVLYACCTGVPPFRGESALAVLRRVNEEAPPPLRTLNPEVPAWLETLVARLMAKEAGDRFQSAAEVVALLESYLAHLRQPAAVPAPSFAVGTRRKRSSNLLATLILVGLGLVGFIMILAQPIPGQRPPPREVYQDFRGRQFSDRLFRVDGPDAEERIRTEREGLRITLPEQQPSPGPVGLVTQFAIRGNFDITVSYALLQADLPKAGWGVGFEVWLVTDTPNDEAASFLRLVRPKAGDVYASNRMALTSEGRVEFKLHLPDLPAGGSSGQLRITRTGSEAVLSAAEEDGQGFRELYRFDLGTADVKTLRLAANPGGAANPVDLRVVDFQVLAVELVNGDDAVLPPRRWRLWSAVGLLAGIVMLGSLWMWRQAKHAAPNENRSQPMQVPPSPVSGRPANAEGDPDVASFPCSGCGTNLKVKGELAGKKVKCPQCGQVVRVPGAKTSGPATGSA